MLTRIAVGSNYDYNQPGFRGKMHYNIGNNVVFKYCGVITSGLCFERGGEVERIMNLYTSVSYVQ